MVRAGALGMRRRRVVRAPDVPPSVPIGPQQPGQSCQNWVCGLPEPAETSDPAGGFGAFVVIAIVVFCLAGVGAETVLIARRGTH